ncbi:glycosyltransferase family 2 protein [Hymenobacter actinosclerus]|nr:glycosyltransferase family A protein [Hymenobacter actinosclerus]
MPCYNRADILAATVETILQQQETDFELLLIDDGSRDQTLAVAREIATTDARIRVFTQANAERGAARNHGLRQAKGQYVNYFDCDDEMYPRHLRAVREYVSQHDQVEVVHVGYEIIADDGQVLAQVKDFSRQTTNEALLHDNFLACNSVFVRRDVALDNPFVEDRRLASAEDWELWLRIASQYTFHSIEECTFCLREHDGRSLNTIAPDAIRVRDEFFAELMAGNKNFARRYPKQVDYFVANRYTFITLTLALTKTRRLDTLRYLAKAVQADPTVLWRRRFLASLKHLF